MRHVCGRVFLFLAVALSFGGVEAADTTPFFEVLRSIGPQTDANDILFEAQFGHIETPSQFATVVARWRAKRNKVPPVFTAPELDAETRLKDLYSSSSHRMTEKEFEATIYAETQRAGWIFDPKNPEAQAEMSSAVAQLDVIDLINRYLQSRSVTPPQILDIVERARLNWFKNIGADWRGYSPLVPNATLQHIDTPLSAKMKLLDQQSLELFRLFLKSKPNGREILLMQAKLNVSPSRGFYERVRACTRSMFGLKRI